jgi:hypothetical protein
MRRLFFRGLVFPHVSVFVPQTAIAATALPVVSTTVTANSYIAPLPSPRNPHRAIRKFFLFSSGEWARCLAEELTSACGDVVSMRRFALENTPDLATTILPGRALAGALAASGLEADPSSARLSLAARDGGDGASAAYVVPDVPGSFDFLEMS